MLSVATGLLEGGGGVVESDSVLLGRGWGYEHGGPILEGAGDPWHPGVIGQPCVAVPRRQGWVQEGLLCGVVALLSLALLLKGLGQACGRSRGGRVSSAKLCHFT